MAPTSVAPGLFGADIADEIIDANDYNDVREVGLIDEGDMGDNFLHEDASIHTSATVESGSNHVAVIEHPTKSRLSLSSQNGGTKARHSFTSQLPKPRLSLTKQDSSKQPHQQQYPPRKSRSRNSLDLRKLPVDSLLLPSEINTSSVKSKSEVNGEDGSGGDRSLRKMFINSKYSLRTQLMSTYGSVFALTILLLTALCALVALLSADSVETIAHESFDNLAKEIEGTTARYVAEHLSPKLIPEDLVQILWEAAQDRFVGYPNHPGYNEDELVPFSDMESGINKYPIIGNPLPLDWEVKPNVNNENYMEHVQNRWDWYKGDVNQKLSTANSVYYMQGMCDPSITEDLDKTHPTYYPGCAPQNNDITTGGVIAPTTTNYQLHRKASDLTPLLKSLYEYHQDVRSMGYFFANGGSGATMQFPSFGLDTYTNYTSIGCDWLLEETHPYNMSRAIVNDALTRKQINYESICRPKHQIVSSRIYNPMEREWCKDQALHPKQVRVSEPYLDAFTNGISLVTVGKAIYDRLTSEFVGCIAVDLVFESLNEILQHSRLTDNAQVTVVRYNEDGTVVASSIESSTLNSQTATAVTIDAINSGVSKDVYHSIYSLVDYSNFATNDTGVDNSGTVWNATLVRQTYEEAVLHDTETGYRVTGYPIPVPPEEYDPYYRPEFMAIVAIPINEIHEEVDSLLDELDSDVRQLIHISIIAGMVGLMILLLLIVFVSDLLTTPLQYMNSAAADILDKKFGDDDVDSLLSGGSGGSVNGSRTKSTNDMYGNESSYRQNKKRMAHQKRKQKLYKRYQKVEESNCTPKTEINEVVDQFKKMISQFSGLSMAKSMGAKIRETKNDFPLSKQFEKLYESRQGHQHDVTGKRTKFKYCFNESSVPQQQHTFGRIHFGTNAIEEDDELGMLQDSEAENNFVVDKMKQNVWNSSLFFWIVVLMVVPFLMTAVIISGIFLARAANHFNSIIIEAEQSFVAMEKKALDIYVGHRAHLTSVLMSRAVRDNYVVTRFTHWLLFDGVKRNTTTYTEMVSVPKDMESNDTCVCHWDNVTQSCYDKSSMGYRYSQKVFFASQSQDNDAKGNRNTTSFPEVANSPDTLEWWDDPLVVPGNEIGPNASGYDTLYDRLRVLSAMPIWQPLWNQDVKGEYLGGLYLGFEMDGTLTGYGCGDSTFLHYIQQRSNQSAELYPHVCPYGKYGYDSRCRPWYTGAKSDYETYDSYLYVTPPYVYSGGVYVGQSVTSPILDYETDTYLGSTLVDLEVTQIIGYLNKNNTPLRDGGFPILITATINEVINDDTIMGPGYNSSEPNPITYVMFQSDPNCIDEDGDILDCESRQVFTGIVAKMKHGGSGTAEYTRTSVNHATEHIYMAYAPILLHNFHAISHSDFSRGVNGTDHLIFSLALAETEEGLLIPFREVKADLNKQLAITLIIVSVVIVVASTIVVFISYKIAISVTKPLIYLLELIGHINRLNSYEEAPEADMERRGQSLEIVNVSRTMEALYNVICSANVSFFTGDMEKAYRVLTDALKLYRRLDNKKGISIACNNLGNMMLAFYRTMQATGEERVCGFTRKQIIAKGTFYFHEAIQLGELAYDAFYEAQGWSPICLDFMQHLSNRYFNRAMFLLTIKDSHEKPEEIKELGLRDVQIARDMDVEIVEEGTQAGWGGVRTSDKFFDVMLTRLRGHLLLQEMGYPDEYDTEECLEDAFNTVRNELKRAGSTGNSVLFQRMTSAGRMQQIETELMRYEVLKGDVVAAARIAIRMLVEDDYILLEAQTKAVEVLVEYANSPHVQTEGEQFLSSEEKDRLLQYKRMLKEQEENMEMVKEKSNSTNLSSSTILPQMRCSSVRATQRGDFTMEMF